MISTSDYSIDPGEYATGLRGYTLSSVFKEAVFTRKDQPAVFDGESYRTWHEWMRDTSALARSLQELGVSKGDVVALQLPNCWEYLIVHIAVAMIGAVLFPLPMAYGEYELRVLLERTNASVLVLPATSLQRNLLAPGRHLSLGHLLVIGSEKQDDEISVEVLIRQWSGASPLPVHVAPDDPCVLIASSGTTSLHPKICIHSHDGLLSNAAAVMADGKVRPDDTVISASPFTHLFGLLSIHLSILADCQQALISRWNTERFLTVVHRSAATIAFIVPTQLRDVCVHLDTHANIAPISLREIRASGAQVPESLLADVRRILDANVLVQWGMTEVGAGTSTRPGDPAEAASRSIGRPITHGEVRIVSESGDVLPTGETGSLWYRSPYMFRGYLYDASLTREVVTRDGWLRTGDLACCNEDGTIAYRGRRTELINRGGMKFSAVEVESLLADLVPLRQYSIIAYPDERLGERSCLAASLRPGYTITLADVQVHLAVKGLAKYKWPEVLHLLGELPSTPTGKIARARLTEQIRAKEQSTLPVI